MRNLLGTLFLLCVTFIGQAQNVKVSGTVTDAKLGEGIPGATVQIKGSGKGTITDLDGNYQIDAEKGSTLVFSFIGMQPQDVVVNQPTINVKLVENVSDLDELVVVGYGAQKKSLVTGAIAKVDGAELSRGSNVRVAQAMQGKTAGVVAVPNSGQPGDNISVRIRGTGTNGDNSPLYIVDGLPLSEAGIDFLNPADVESLEVLKDAAASAIYGARGANGVVIITTKGGKKESPMRVSYDAYYGVQNPWKKLAVLDRDEYIMLTNEANTNVGLSPLIDPNGVYANTDWQDEMFYYNAPKESHTVSFEGGSKKTTYSSSINYFSQEGIVAKGQSSFDRISFRLNTVSDFGFLSVGNTINYANIKNKGIGTNDMYSAVSLVQALNTPPIVPVTNEDGSWGTPADMGLALQEITNPIAMLSYTNSETKTNKFIGNFFAELDFGDLIPELKGLKIKSTYGQEFTLVDNRGYSPEYYLDPTHFSTIDGVSRSMDVYTKWNFENVVTYNKKLGIHNFTAMLGTTAFKEVYENISGSKKDVIFNDFDHAYLDNATDPTSAIVGGTKVEHTLQSYFGRINYDLKDRYMFTAVARRDGSSRFGTENKYGIFPAVSGGWILSQEDFFEGARDYVNILKLRASWGQNGNENIGDFGYTSLIDNNYVYYFGDGKTQVNGTAPGKLSNPTIQWETSEQTNLGIDLGLLDNKLRVGLDYYIKTTKDWLVDAPAPALIGTNVPTINGGEVENRGFEFETSYKNKFGKLGVNISLNGSFNKNEVIDIQNTEKRLQSGDGGRYQSGIMYATVGTPLGVFYGLKTDGIFQTQSEIDAYVNSAGELLQPKAAPGDIKFIDADGDGIIDANADRVVIGDPFPEFTGGLNIGLDYEGFDFNMAWYTSIGQDIWDATRRYDLNGTNYRADYLNRWTGPGTSNDMPRVSAVDANGNMSTPSDFFVKDGSFARLRNLTIGYTLPKRLTSTLQMQKCRVYVSGENLITLTNYDGMDPEIGGAVFANGIDRGVYPQAKTVLAGINITF